MKSILTLLTLLTANTSWALQSNACHILVSANASKEMIERLEKKKYVPILYNDEAERDEKRSKVEFEIMVAKTALDKNNPIATSLEYQTNYNWCHMAVSVYKIQPRDGILEGLPLYTRYSTKSDLIKVFGKVIGRKAQDLDTLCKKATKKAIRGLQRCR